MKNLEKACERLQECGLRLNIGKCKFMQEKLEVLGFTIDKEGLHKSKSKIDAMVNAPQPKNVKELVIPRLSNLLREIPRKPFRKIKIAL